VGCYLLILCAAREHDFSVVDAFAAGRLMLEALEGRSLRKGLNEAALVAVVLARRYGPRFDRPLLVSAAGRQLRALGYGDDVAHAALVDRHPVLPVFHDRRITLAPPTAPSPLTSPSP
jgi:phosphosulfolactate phosphohydrolase-like enzyme